MGVYKEGVSLYPGLAPCCFRCTIVFSSAEEVYKMRTWELHRFLKISSWKWNQVLLALSWSCGLLCGCLLFYGCGSLAVLLAQAASLGVSFRNLMIANGLPFLLFAFAVYIRQPGLLPVLAFGKGCLFAYISMGALVAFGGAGCLLRLLLMFSDLFLTVLLYFCWERYLSGQERFSAFHWGAVAALVFLVGAIDYCWIVPILVRVI